jgi:hypothetical protein
MQKGRTVSPESGSRGCAETSISESVYFGADGPAGAAVAAHGLMTTSFRDGEMLCRFSGPEIGEAAALSGQGGGRLILATIC